MAGGGVSYRSASGAVSGSGVFGTAPITLCVLHPNISVLIYSFVIFVHRGQGVSAARPRRKNRAHRALAVLTLPPVLVLYRQQI